MKSNLWSQDALAGLFFIAFGAFALYLNADYPAGTAVRMGPGYFPRVVGWITVALGILIAANGLFRGGELAERPQWRALVFVTAGIVLFGVLVDRAGLVIATAVLIGLARFAGPDYRRVGETVLQFVVLTAGVAALFVWALRLPIPIWPA